MNYKKFSKNKTADKFSFGLNLIVLAIAVTLIAFITENRQITGFVIVDSDTSYETLDYLKEFDNVDSLTLSKGVYYIKEDGIIYWIDNEPIPVAKVENIDETQKNRFIYIDDEGRVGYILKIVSYNEI